MSAPLPRSPPLTAFRYEVRKTLLSTPLLVVVVVIVVLSFGVIQGFVHGNQPSTVSDRYSGLYFAANSQIHFAFYAYNTAGASVPGVSFALSFFYQDQYGNPNGSPVANVSLVTGASGIAEGAASPSNWNNSGGWLVVGNLTDPNATGFSSNHGHTQQISIGVCSQCGAPGTIQYIGNVNGGLDFGPWDAVKAAPGSSAPMDLQMFYLARNGTDPSGDTVRFAIWNSTTQNPTPVPENQTHLVGTLTGPVGQFPLLISPSSAGSQSSLIVEVFTPQGSMAAFFSNGPGPNTFFLPPTTLDAETYVVEYVGALMAIFVPLMAIMAAYSGYGSDRVNGTIESVLAQPVTRQGLVLSRYLAVLVALGVALAIAASVVVGLVHYYAGVYLPATMVFELFVSLFLSGAAFVSLVFLLSYTLRSSGAVIGAAVGLFMLFAFFWTQLLIPLITTYSGLPSGSAGFYSLTYGLEFASPAGVVTLAQALIVNLFQGQGFSIGAQIDPGRYGVTWFTVGAVAVAWVVVPMIALSYLVRTRD